MTAAIAFAGGMLYIVDIVIKLKSKNQKHARKSETMNRNDIKLRIATPSDAEAILKIYAYYVENTVITFEYDVPELAEFRGRIENTLKRYPYIVAEHEGEVVGYAYLGAFVGRKAYDWSAETTIYLANDRKKMGLGRIMYQALENLAKAQNIINLNACIGYPEVEDEYLNKNSAQFHAHLGYDMVGEFHKCGFKFGRWYDMVWMEKMIGEHGSEPAPLIPFPQLDAETVEECLK